MRKALYIILLMINGLSAILLLFSYLATHISPAILWPLAFFGLGYHYLMLINTLFIFLWIIKLEKVVFISITAIVIGWNHHRAFIPLRLFNSKQDIAQETEYKSELRILSYNVRAFNIYDWLDDSETSTNIFNLIRSENPDIICLQEYFTANHHSGITDLFKEKVYSHIYYSGNKKTGNFGIATYSRFPIIHKGLIRSPNTSNVTLYTDILVDSDTFRIYNNHLQSINFKQSNYDFIDNPRFRYDEKNLNEVKDITRRLKKAYVKRSTQVDNVSAHIRISPNPVIVCGDFNDTPVSYTYRKMRAGLTDSFVSSGTGLGKTYLGIFPSFRIDYIFHSSCFYDIDFERVKANLSDHYPIICRLGYSPTKN